MHEYGIVQSLVARVGSEVAARGATGVHSITVCLGEQSGVDPSLLTLAWESFVAEGPCAGAALVLEEVPLRWACRGCGRDLAPGSLLRCPDCGAAARLVQGDEIVLARIEMEVPDV